jgi:hypothetical protein
MNMPTPGRRKAWKWLVGFVLVIVCGLTASPVRAVVEDCNDYQIDKEPQTPPGSKCGGLSSGQLKKLITVTITGEITFVDCGLAIGHPPSDTEVSVILKGCALEVVELGKFFTVDVADVQPETTRLSTCSGLPGCLEDPQNLSAFIDGGLPPKSDGVQFSDCKTSFNDDCTLTLIYDTTSLSNLCKTSSDGFVAVIGQLGDGATTKEDRDRDVSGAFIRGVVKCP